jgi:hypothetical protein
MTKLIYQVAVGPKSKLYEHCIQSVADYAERIGAKHIVQRDPILMIKPNPFTSNRSEGASRLGYLPIYEKENAFDHMNKFDQIAIIDSDVYVRENARDVFETLSPETGLAASIEGDMPINAQYVNKIKNYSRMQYQTLFAESMMDKNGYRFANMGVMVMNSKVLKPFLKGQSAREFISRHEFQDFVDGKGAWKWSTDQTLLNNWVYKHQIPFQNLDWRFNGLFGANTKIKECDFIHFFLKDHLPNKGEDVTTLMKQI